MFGLLDRTVMWVTMRQLFARRRIWFGVAFALAPLLFTLLFKLIADDGGDARLRFATGLGREIVLGTLLPIAAVIFATTTFGGEIDDGTLVYLLVKPIPRWKVVLSKLVVAILSTFAVIVPAVVLPWVVLRGEGFSDRVPVSLLAAALGSSVLYSALFLAMGLRTRRALILGLVYVIVFEGALTRNLAGLKWLSVREFAVAISEYVGPGALAKPAYVVPMSTVIAVGTLMLVAATGWSMRRLSRFEMAERL